MKPPKMDELRKQNYKIKVTHFRVTQHGIFSRREIDETNDASALASQTLKPTDPTPIFHAISPCGGRVEVEIEYDGLHSQGVSVTSRKDNFKRKIGTAMAYGRAWKPFYLIGEQAPGAIPIGTEIAEKKSKLVGTVKGSRETGIGPFEYVIAWNAKPDFILCISGDDIDLKECVVE